MLKNPINTPEVDQKVRAAIRQLMTELMPGSTKITSCEIRSTKLEPTGYSFTIVVQGAVLPKTETPA